MGDPRIGSSIPPNVQNTDLNSVDGPSQPETPEAPVVAAKTQEGINEAGIESSDYLDVEPLKNDLDPAVELKRMLQEVDPNQAELRTPGQMTQQLLDRGRMQFAVPLAGPAAPQKEPTGLAEGQSSLDGGIPHESPALLKTDVGQASVKQKIPLDGGIQLLQKQLAEQIDGDPWSDGDVGETGKTGRFDSTTVQAGPDVPKPETIQDFVVDKVTDRISKEISKLKPDFKKEQFPPQTAEQEALHDLAAGVKKYQEYVAYAQNAAAILKHAPNSHLKDALVHTLGDMNALADKIDSVASKLKSVGKYATLVSDAVDVATNIRDLVGENFDLSNRAGIEKFSKSLQKTTDSAQSFFDRGRDALIASGRAGAGVALAYFTGIASIGVDGLAAGVKNVNAYIDRLKETTKLIERGGIKEKLPEPTPPPPVKSYAELRAGERQEKVLQVGNLVETQFNAAKEGVKRAFQAKHQAVHDRFDQDVFPKIYLQNRKEIIQDLRTQLKNLSNDELKPGETRAGRMSQVEAINHLLTRMENTSASSMTPGQIREEIMAVKMQYGTPDGRGGTIPKSNGELFKQYNAQLDKFYEKNGLGEGALDKEYQKHGLTRDAELKVFHQMVAQLGL